LRISVEVKILILAKQCAKIKEKKVAKPKEKQRGNKANQKDLLW